MENALIHCLNVCPVDQIKPVVFSADQVDIHLLRCQQLRLYILKAARALLSHQDKLRQILCQPAVVDTTPNPSGKTSPTEGLSLEGKRGVGQDSQSDYLRAVNFQLERLYTKSTNF